MRMGRMNLKVHPARGLSGDSYGLNINSTDLRKSEENPWLCNVIARFSQMD